MCICIVTKTWSFLLYLKAGYLKNIIIFVAYILNNSFFTFFLFATYTVAIVMFKEHNNATKIYMDCGSGQV